MPLSINQEVSMMRDNSDNPYALTPSEVAQVKDWEALSDDQKGEHIHSMKELENVEQYVADAQFNEYINSNTIQTLAGGGAVVGGELRPDALVTIGCLEMTVQQAVDAGVYDSSAPGMQTSDMPEQPQTGGSLAGIPMSEVFVNDHGQVLAEEDGQYYLFDESDNQWYAAEFD